MALLCTPLDVDWQAIRAAYMMGKSWADIAQQFNVKLDTVRRRGYREDWATIKAKARPTLQTVTVKVERKDEKPQSLALKESIAKTLDDDMKVVAGKCPSSLVAVAQRQAIVSQIVSNAKIIHGWGEQQQSTLVSLGMLSGQEQPMIAVGQQAVSKGQHEGQDEQAKIAHRLSNQSLQPIIDVTSDTTASTTTSQEDTQADVSGDALNPGNASDTPASEPIPNE